MGNFLSSVQTRVDGAEHVRSESVIMNHENIFSDEEKSASTSSTNENEDEARNKVKAEEMNEFKKQLSLKREQRKEILARHRAEKEDLERSLQSEKADKLELCQRNKLLCDLLIKNNIDIPEHLLDDGGESKIKDTLIQMREEFITIKSNNTQLRKDLAETNSTLQNAYSDIADLNARNTESIKQIRALKEVVAVSKTMINLREEQLNELKNKLNEIERTLADKETNLLSADLRKEYVRQLQNIRTLRVLYEERARLAEVTRQGLVRELDEHKVLYQAEVKKSKSLTDKLEELETKIDSLIETIENKNSQISSYKQETNGLKAEMAVVNRLFSQVLLGYKTNQDLDTLVHRLQENHGILTQMAERENGSEVSSELPKLLLEIVSQVDESEDQRDKENQEPKNSVEPSKEEMTSFKESTSQKGLASAEDIVESLPKVWKVLIELLSHQNTSDDDSSEKVTTCYKSVETASGPVLVPSVSQTYIRLKDLIIEKLGLIKEVNRMKQLNVHLETRLGEQERRLCLVTSELSKTWHVVGRLRRHHQQLHTHEKILKYELQQKRKLLNELKEELEYCREKWEQAREKNTQSEKDWRTLRAEFSSRKTKAGSPLFSGESGYSDERPSDDSSESNDESEYVSQPLLRYKKKIKKSYESPLNSSGDFNLVAEREDPASDMLDVADLPLDTQENDELISEHSKNGVFSTNETTCEKTEDEVANISRDDSCREKVYIENPSNNQSITATNNNNQQDDLMLFITSSYEQSNNASNLTIDSPSTSSLNNCRNEITELCNAEIVSTVSPSKIVSDLNEEENLQQIGQKKKKNTNALENSADTSPLNFKEILENVRKQDERLAKRDERLQKMEECCSKVVKNITDTLNSGDNIIKKLDSLHNEHHNTNNNNETMDESCFKTNNSSLEKDDSEPSTSIEVDHEARFAARDLRLKRLEEQTKSLVTKVNNTTSKGVKIHYKLEELHNIYGSESSRAGTPSDELEGTADDVNNDENQL